MLEVLANFNPQPESVPINALMAIKGTPMEENGRVDSFEFIRMIAITRIAIPKAKVRLSAGRTQMNKEAQALAFFAGANSIFYGDKLLTAANPRVNEDQELLKELGMTAQAPNPSMDIPEADFSKPMAPTADGCLVAEEAVHACGCGE